MQAGTPPPIRQIPGATQAEGVRSDSQISLPGGEVSGSVTGPGTSAIAEALRDAEARSPPPVNSAPLRPLSPGAAGAALPEVPSLMGSFDGRRSIGGRGSPMTYENPEIVRRHLVLPTKGQSTADRDRKGSGKSSRRSPSAVHGRQESSDEEFSSLRLQGGDITRQVYRWTEEAEAESQGRGRTKRSRSFDVSRPNPASEVLDINSIKQPGGFRRNYLRRAAESPSPAPGGYGTLDSEAGFSQARPRPKLLTSNFIEFLSLYGHFAGEELEEDDEVLGPDEYFSSDAYDEGDYFTDEGEEGREPGEGSALLTPGTPGKRRRKRKERAPAGSNSASGAVLLLLKSFVGTGVLFLPKAYLNGGMLFSNVVLLVVALLSYYCFILLVNTRLAIDGSFGDIGGILYGKHMRNLILVSIVVSQIGFASAYIVFTSENLQAFILAVSHCRTFIDIKLMILMQLIIFLPLSLIRNISKLGATALVADLLILLGLIYLYYYDIFTLVAQHGVADIVQFNAKDWTLFIGTAIFTFEGIGLIIPIQESMKKPKQFPPVLAGVMVLITVVFMSMGALSYAAYGSKTQTVVILNMPQDNKFVNGVQFLYSVAILLSTPLQLFPAIRITENELFTRSGKYNPYIKWKKNIFRFFLVMLCALIAWVGAGDLDKFVALVGSFACVPLVYVYPPLLHVRAVARTRFQRISDYAILVFGLVVMIYTTVLTLKSWAGGPAKEAPGYCKN
ncbi:hypothetical protein L228DRAFT_208893 [Xylona heveae TC161]|uniref:Amino acid transporter transmembrane domain-containing protein n=1 Tax=Xylona heveae (strain CBS 132557 / TC161) TaxID=1328760 RepID=A0A165IDF7_XYLHT|nr:hypothetical protein L228DRAFT_208893 [Xylona heveae TC161]KZF24740.1 hypothetical protein L228DRAFT_208893 [Xylona heveae TC161]